MAFYTLIGRINNEVILSSTMSEISKCTGLNRYTLMDQLRGCNYHITDMYIVSRVTTRLKYKKEKFNIIGPGKYRNKNNSSTSIPKLPQEKSPD